MLGPQLVIEEDPTPLAMAIEADLRRRLRDPAFVELTTAVRGSVGIRVGEGPEAVTVVVDDPLTVRHGLDSPQVLIRLDPRHRWSGVKPAGFEDHPELARWASAFASPSAADWRDAAALLWSELEHASGAPAALLVTELDSGGQLRFGDGERAYEIRGAREALLDLLEGRSALMEEVAAGSIEISGSFPEISVITGAMWRVRTGGGGGDG